MLPQDSLKRENLKRAMKYAEYSNLEYQFHVHGQQPANDPYNPFDKSKKSGENFQGTFREHPSIVRQEPVKHLDFPRNIMHIKNLHARQQPFAGLHNKGEFY